MTIMRVGFFQFTPRFGEVSHNLDKVVATLDRADADLIVLPELFASGYQFVSQQEAIALSELVPNGPTTQRLIDLAKRRGMVIVAGLPERAGVACYNSGVIARHICSSRKHCSLRQATQDFRCGISGWLRSA
jgi:predicted amidohydrolase